MNPDAPDSEVTDDPVATSTELREHIGELLKDMRQLQEESERLRLESEESRRIVKIPHKSDDDTGQIFETKADVPTE
jgi:hypothetical protein